MNIRSFAGAVAAMAALTLPVAVLAQAPAKDLPKPPVPKEAPKPVSKEGPVATVNGVAIPQSRIDVMVRERAQQGVPDSPELRSAIREDLINREIIAQEATRSGLLKKPEIAAELDFIRQNYVVQTYVREWARTHPAMDAEVQKEYDRARSATGDKEYRARHILVETEEEAKALITDLKKGSKFEDLAAKTKDEGSKERGGDLDWNVPSVFDKAFADAMVKLEKGKITETPVRSRFGFHVIRLDDVRPVRFPPLAEVKDRIQQQLMQRKLEKLMIDLRAKAKVE